MSDYDSDSDIQSESSDYSSESDKKPLILTPKGEKPIDINLNPIDVDEDENADDEDDEDDAEDVDDEEDIEDDEDDDEDSMYDQEGEEKNDDKKKDDKKGKGKKNEEHKKSNPEYKKQEDDADSDEETDENYLQKFDIDINKNYLLEVHPECLHHNYDEIEALTVIVRDANNIIIDPLHRTIPFLTKYERARILGQRAKQINMGAQAFVEIPENVIDGIIVAELELKQKKIPFIIKRPLPNGACEYWNVNDLENILY